MAGQCQSAEAVTPFLRVGGTGWES